MGGIKNDNRVEKRFNISNTQKGRKDECENYIGIALLPQFTKYCQGCLIIELLDMLR
jgi:hypothetical protein